MELNLVHYLLSICGLWGKWLRAMIWVTSKGIGVTVSIYDTTYRYPNGSKLRYFANRTCRAEVKMTRESESTQQRKYV